MSEVEQSLVKTVQIGDRLRQARISAGLEISDVATDLRINPSYIEALELNQFEQVGAPTYVKGYLRNYANVLKLSPEGLIAEYESLGYEAPDLSTVSPLDSIEGNNKLLHLFSLLVAMVTLGLFVYWLINSGYNNDYSAQSSVVEYTEPPSPLPLEQAPSTLPLTNVSEVDPDVLAQGINTADSDALLSVPLVGETEVTEVLTDEVVVEATEPDATAMVAEVSGIAGTSVQTFSAEDMISATDGFDEVMLTLTAESWVEIEDATHFQLMKGVYPAGTTKILTGQAPFQVFLGFAPGVEIIFNDVVYQSEPHRRANNTAKFALIN